ncbi:Unknown protein sequence [Pseudomonas syringae pv. maculicola]|nr:Unknown protein sequence [Pseudomonas syringae pv. maculicola str. M6]KPB93736.1 Unknown protein sequence [Pseudomonas syringae pv. maculicola]KPC16246.1 Unknown protein sequence [Pseudomonas syringae pv. maculicola]
MNASWSYFWTALWQVSEAFRVIRMPGVIWAGYDGYTSQAHQEVKALERLW